MKRRIPTWKVAHRWRYVAIFLVMVVAVGSLTTWWLFARQPKPVQKSITSSQLVAEQFIDNLQADRLNEAMALTWAPGDRELTQLLSITMARLGTSHTLIKHESRVLKEQQQISYIFRLTGAKGYDFMRVIVVRVDDQWKVRSSFPNSSEPSLFPADNPPRVVQ